MYPWLVWCSLFWQFMELLWTPCISRTLFQALTDSEKLSSRLESVVVWSRVGKEFPDMRQSEREIKFIRVGDAVRPAGHLKGELTLSRGPSVQFSHSVVSDSLRPHGLQHSRPPCPSSTPRVYSNSCPLSQWCHPTISSSVVPFSSHLQSFPASGSFQMSQLFTSGGQSIGVSVSASVPPMNTQDWSPLEWTGWAYICCYCCC